MTGSKGLGGTDRPDLTILERSPADLEAYERVSIAFLVTSRLRVEPMDGGLGGLALVEERVEEPYVRDFDEEEKPTDWSERWDISHWGVLAAFQGASRVGGAVIVWRTPGVRMLEGRSDQAVLWDIRVVLEHRGQGVGSMLFARAMDWARERGCSVLKVETQTINVGACRFYARQGCELRTIRSRAYADAPDEVQLLWYRELAPTVTTL